MVDEMNFANPVKHVVIDLNIAASAKNYMPNYWRMAIEKALRRIC